MLGSTRGYQTEQVDMERRRLVFRRGRAADPQGVPPKTGSAPAPGLMKGTVTEAPGFDPTAPGDPDWGSRAYGDGR